MAYFDWNATAPLLPASRDVWLEASTSSWANPSTAYRLGVQARLALDEARERIAGRMNCHPEQVVFTSGATEANNGFIREAAWRARPEEGIWLSGIEHPSVQEAARAHWGSGRITRIPVLPGGAIDLDWIGEKLKAGKPALVSVMAANNETGVLQPWPSVRDLCRATGVAFHCDAVQWVGKASPSDWSGCSAVTLSGHKLGAPKGVGCLILSNEWKGIRIQAGGSQEMEMRAGTENIPGAVAMAEAFRCREEASDREALRRSRDDFERALQREWPGQSVIHGAGADRLWNTSSVSLPEFRSERWIAQLDRLGFQVSSGSACSTGKAGPSPVLQAMGVEEGLIRRTIRISGGWETTPGEWEALLQALLEARNRLGESGSADGPGRVIQI